MVFGLFARKPDESASPFQLHTPTPSISNSEPPTAPPPLSLSPPPNPLTVDPQIPHLETEITNPIALYDLIRSVPPQTLHAYTLSHILPVSTSDQPPPSPRTLTVLTHFFSTLSPPPQLHCVRCHAAFFELSNMDSSCRVPHDDESALVDRSAYETLWGCCGHTVEGTGDMGPPDGWCYEGKHTTDVKRARFRKDSTLRDDKLVSCAAMGCYGRKRQRSESVSSDDVSISVGKKDKGKIKAKPIDHSSPKPATARKPVSKSSVRPTPKPLSKTSSVTPARGRTIQKSHLRQSHIASPVVDNRSESESDTPAPAPARHKSTSPRNPEPPRKPEVPARSTRERINTKANTNSRTLPIADEHRGKPRTRSVVREERSLSRPRAGTRGDSVRILREHSEREKGVSESDSDERERGRGREVKKRRVG